MKYVDLSENKCIYNDYVNCPYPPEECPVCEHNPFRVVQTTERITKPHQISIEEIVNDNNKM